MDGVIYRCRVKATDRVGDLVRWSWNWILARHGDLRLTERTIECGDWTIPYAVIDEAVLFEVHSTSGDFRMLRVKSRGKTYQFGLKSTSFWRYATDPCWSGEMPFPMGRGFTRLCPLLSRKQKLWALVAYGILFCGALFAIR
jgi:hypothetical protein